MKKGSFRVQIITWNYIVPYMRQELVSWITLARAIKASLVYIIFISVS